MTRFAFESTPFRRRLVLAGAMLLTVTASMAHGQGRSFRPRPFVTPSRTPSMMRFRTPARTPAQTNALLRREVGLNSMLRRNLRFDRMLRRDLGFGPFGGTSGGGFAGSGLIEIPVGVGVGTTTTASQNSTGDTEASARTDLLLEKALAARLENRRKAFDELQYERDKAPTVEQVLLSHSRANPSPAEVLSGQALNALLDDLRATSGTDPGDRLNPRLPLDARGLKHINVTRGAGNVALLKDGGRLTWPAALAGEVFQGPRERLTAQAPEAVRQAANSRRLDPAALRQMADDADQLRTLLRQQAKGLSFQQYTEARNFLQRFDDALAALGGPDAANYFNGAYELQAQTVLGLVKQMTDRGLRFAPAAPGDEAAYTALREALAASDRAAAKPLSAAR